MSRLKSLIIHNTLYSFICTLPLIIMCFQQLLFSINLLFKFILIPSIGLVYIFLFIYVFVKKSKIRSRLIIYTCSIVFATGIHFSNISSLIMIGIIHSSNHSIIAVFKNHREEIPVLFGDRCMGKWIIQSKDWLISADEKEVLKNYFHNRKYPIECSPEACYFILGGFIDNAWGYAYVFEPSSNPPFNFCTYDIISWKPITSNWYFFTTT